LTALRSSATSRIRRNSSAYATTSASGTVAIG
jgi:hypothetical protein